MARSGSPRSRAGREEGTTSSLVHESLAEYAAALDAIAGPDERTWRDIATAVERYAYGGEQLSTAEWDLLVASAGDLRIGRWQSIVSH